MKTVRPPLRAARAQPEVALGRIVGVFGLRGEYKIAPSRIGEDVVRAKLDVVMRFRDDRPERSLRIARCRRHKALFVAASDGVETIEAAEAFVGAQLWVPRASISLATGEYFDDDLVGCVLVDGAKNVGTVTAVRHYPAQDVLELEGGAFVPLVSAFVRGIDIAARRIAVELPPGLVEGEPEEA